MPDFNPNVHDIHQVRQALQRISKTLDDVAYGGAVGDVYGPASSTDNAITRFNGTDGKNIQNSGASIDDSGNLTANNFSGTHSGTSSGTNTGDQTITLTGDVTGTGTGTFAATIANDSVTDAKLRDSAALSVMGNATNALANPADIAAAADGQVLRRGGAALAFGAVDLANVNAVTGTLPVGNGGTGITSLGAGVATWLGTPTSANLASAVTDETGTGALVFANSPTLVTPALGTPASGTLTNCTGLPVSTGVSGLGTGVATFLATPTSANLASALTDETGTGAAVFATSPTLVTPLLGTPTSGTLTNCTGLPLTTGVTGTLPVANGGTGRATITSGAFLVGNGTTAVQMVGPGSAGRIPVSSGSGIVMQSVGGDATMDGSGTLTLGNNVVSNAKFRQSAGFSVVAKASTGTGIVADVIASANGQILVRRSDAISFASPLQYAAKSADYTVVATDNASVINVSASGASRTITLTAAATLGNGFSVTIKRSDSTVANTVTIDANSTETIDGDTTVVLRAQYQSVTLVCDGSNWHIVNWGVAQGTWSPVLSGGTTPGTPTYSTQLGRYQLNGKVCNYWIRLVTSGLSTAAGNTQISLPFTSATVSSFFWGGASGCANVNLNAGGGYYYCVPLIASNASNLLLYEVGDNVGQNALQITALATVTDFIISGSYQVT